jgi:hypothetical protein
VTKVRLVVAVLILLAGGLSWGISKAQPAGEQYFNETGHWVRGEFLTAYYSAANPEEIYGLPISSFFKVDSNTWVQYFQKARFELHLDYPKGQQVVISELGSMLYQPGAGTPFADNSANCRQFAESRFEVCASFLDYFDSHGGIAQFGEPISNTEIMNGVVVQHFEKARFEYRPEFPPGQKVVLVDLGIIYFHYNKENRVYLRAEPGDPTIEGTVRLKARAYPVVGVTKLSGEQTIHVVVQDQRLFSVQGALVSLEIVMPHGKEAPVLYPGVTNENGIATFNIEFDMDRPGLVEIVVTVEKNDILNTTTVTSFRTWW